MKKYLLTLFTALLCLAANAANEAYFYVSNKLEAKPGETVKLAVAMKNEKSIIAFQTYVGLPAGISFNKVLNEDNEEDYDAGLTDRKKAKHNFSIDEVGGVERTLLFIGEPTDGKSIFKDNDGDVFTVNLNVDPNIKPGDYQIKLSNIRFTADEGAEDPSTIKQEDFTVPITIYEDYSINVECDETMGTVTGSGTYRSGAEVTLEATPNEGYHFVKWSNDVTDNPYKFVADGDLSLKAEFDANTYMITYYVDGVKTESVPAKYGSKIERLAEPAKPGYTFSGWDTELPETMPAHDIEVNGTFAINQYTLTFYPENGEESIIITQDYGTAVSAPSDLEREGYTFVAWDKEVPETMPAENMEFKAQWSVNTYKLVYYLDGEEYKAFEYNYGTKIEKEADPEAREGYTFSGWSEIPETMPAHDVEVSGEFTINQYTITLNLYDGAEPIVIRQNYGTEIETPANPEREGYTFVNWDKEIPATMPAEDMVINAEWRVNQYELVYFVDGEVYKNYAVDYGMKITPEEYPAKYGYVFSGWEGLPETMPARNVEVSGTFSIGEFTLTFNLYEGAEPVVITAKYGEAVKAPEVPTREGYEFLGWDKDIPETMPGENMEITAQWKTTYVLLTYLVDGEVYKQYQLQPGAAVEPEPEPEAREGYTFSGWNWMSETMPAYNVVVEGSFIANQYTIIFDTDGGNHIDPITQDYGTAVTPPADPEREGYTFTGWLPSIPESMPAYDIVITATWKVNTYKLTYIVDGEFYKEYDVEYGTELTPEKAPVKEGYTFSGWDNLPETMPACDYMVYGSFRMDTGLNAIGAETDKVTVYDLNGNLVVRDVTLGEFYKKYPKGMYIVNGKKIAW